MRITHTCVHCVWQTAFVRQQAPTTKYGWYTALRVVKHENLVTFNVNVKLTCLAIDQEETDMKRLCGLMIHFLLSFYWHRLAARQVAVWSLPDAVTAAQSSVPIILQSPAATLFTSLGNVTVPPGSAWVVRGFGAEPNSPAWDAGASSHQGVVAVQSGARKYVRLGENGCLGQPMQEP